MSDTALRTLVLSLTAPSTFVLTTGLITGLTTAHASWSVSTAKYWVEPGKQIGDVIPQASNNNVSIERHEGALFMVWRSSKDHFASNTTVTHVVYSLNEGETWVSDLNISIDGDVREGLLKSIDGVLHLYYFEGGTNPRKFEPRRVVHRYRLGPNKWSEPESISGAKEVLWDLKTYKDVTYKLSYQGPHYRFRPGDLYVKLETSTDGRRWEKLPQAKNSVVYTGGVSETAVEFDNRGNLWGVGRNEDGDTTGFGTQIFFAKAGELHSWWSLKKSLRERYDSPKMFRHNGEIYLLSRRCLGPKFNRGLNFLPFNVKRWLYLGLYSLQTMRTSLFRLNTNKLDLDWILDLPSTGDNAFPSIVQNSPNEFTVVNYSSPLQHTDWTWIRGQKSSEGTNLYSVKLNWTKDTLIME